MTDKKSGVVKIVLLLVAVLLSFCLLAYIIGQLVFLRIEVSYLEGITVGMSATDVINTFGPPVTVVNKGEILSVKGYYPEHQIENINKILVYMKLNFKIYVVVNEKGIVEQVFWSKT